MSISIQRSGEGWAVRSVTVRVRGRFGFKEGSDIWEKCRPEKQRCQVYFFDFAQTTALHDNGLAWLRMFLRWAREAGRSVRFVNAAAKLCSQLARSGISVNGTAMG